MIRFADNFNWRGKAALLRADLNTPLANGQIADDSRIRASLPTIRHVLSEGGAVVILSHLGRPQEGVFDSSLSLRPAANRISELLQTPVQFHSQIPKSRPSANEVYLLENVRFNRGEKQCAPDLAAQYAATGDVFVLDAFATAHRRECSTFTLAAEMPNACGGFLLRDEISALSRVSGNPARPFLAVVGGAKISTKLPALKKLLQMCDGILVGGGIANTFLAAKGEFVADSLTEESMYKEARELLAAHRGKIILPSDAVVAKEISESATARRVANFSSLHSAEKILDIGEESQKLYAKEILRAKTIVWSGPMGAFECAPFAAGTREIARAVEESAAYSLAGGGDTLAAAARFGAGGISYFSTGGGAFLEFLGGKTLPAIAALQQSAVRGG